jgi:L-ascorbate metabolism protein UlaG (beta-lactamase superfamily)
MKKPLFQDDAFIADVNATRGGSHDSFRLRWLGQSGFLLQWRRSHLLFDPYLSDSLTRKYAGTDRPHVRLSEGVVAPERLTFIDVVTVSHAHTDHCDPDTLRPLVRSNPGITLIGPRAIRDIVEQRSGIQPAVTMVDGSEARSRDFQFFALPAAHNELATDEHGHHKYLGYIVRFGRWTVYHSGDTLLYEGMVERLRRYSPMDVALLPINGNKPERRVAGNLNGREAAQLARDIGAKIVIPCHYDMFEFNTADPADEFIPECERIGQRYRVLRQGERFSSTEIPA